MNWEKEFDKLMSDSEFYHIANIDNLANKKDIKAFIRKVDEEAFKRGALGMKKLRKSKGKEAYERGHRAGRFLTRKDIPLKAFANGVKYIANKENKDE